MLLGFLTEEKLEIIKNKGAEEGISINRACELLQIPKSSFYYKKKGESEENKKIMEMIEGQYSKDLTVGYRKMTEILRKKTEGVNSWAGNFDGYWKVQG